MSMDRKHRNSSLVTKRISQWEELMRNFSEAHKEECKSASLDIPRVHRSVKDFPTGSQYEGTWDLLGMSGYGVYKFPNGVVYEGEFEDGTFHGSGHLIYPNGVILQSKWKRGNLVERTIIFADGYEYDEKGWKYCEMPDRRFTIEHDFGLNPAGASYLTAEQPTRDIPPGYYDTDDGLYDPVTNMVYKADNLNNIIRSPAMLEKSWIIDNCRTNPDVPLGPRNDLYQEWLNPQMTLEKAASEPSSENKLLSISEPYQDLIFDSNNSKYWRRWRESSKLINRPLIQFQSLA